MKKTAVFIALATLCLFFNVKAQNQVKKNVSLNVGDTLPESIWHSPLHLLNRSKSKKIITLNELRGKIILFDFWSTWCGPCIRSLPKLDSIQRKFPDKVQVLLITRDNSERLKAFLTESQYATNVKLQFFSETTFHLDLFPHSTIPHTIIIGKNGKIIAVTGSKGISMKNIEFLIDNKTVEFPLK